jgi:endonuclease/exonuclease/phosphatase family metal-dependent hydrolase
MKKGVIRLVQSCFVATSLILASCNSSIATTSVSTTSTTIPQTTITTTTTSTPAPGDIFTVMTYNILEGAGAEKLAAQYRQSLGYEADSLDEMIDVIKYYNPDIVGIQEAVRWEANNDEIAKYVSAKLGMNYVLAPGWFPEWNVILLTKFEVVDYKVLSGFRSGALQATLRTKSSHILTFYDFHISVPNFESDLRSFDALYHDFSETKYGIVVGDFNQNESDMTYPSNWRDPITGGAGRASGGIDQIWVTKDIGPFKKDIGTITIDQYFGNQIDLDIDKFPFTKISDHLPVIYQTGIY